MVDTSHLSGESEQGDNDGFAQGLQGQSDEIRVVLKIADLGFKNTLLFLWGETEKIFTQKTIKNNT